MSDTVETTDLVEESQPLPRPTPQRVVLWILRVLTLLATAATMLWSAFFVLLAWGLTDGNPDAAFFWVFVASVLGLLWWQGVEIAIMVKGERIWRWAAPGIALVLVAAAMVGLTEGDVAGWLLVSGPGVVATVLFAVQVWFSLRRPA